MMSSADMFAPTARRADAIYRAISALTINDEAVVAVWPLLDELSSQTIFDGIEAVPGGVLIGPDGSFEAAATAFVTLNYGGSRDSAAMSDSYPAAIVGHVEVDGDVVIETVSVDTSSFYGLEDEPQDEAA